MLLIREAKKRSRQIVVPICAAVVAGYFLYHTVHGERGVFAYAELSEQARDAELKLTDIRLRRRAVETDVRLLRHDSLDLDLLEERARTVLNLVGEDDLLIHSGIAR